MKRIAVSLVLLLVLGTSVHADLASPATLTVKETSPCRFSVEFTLPIIQGRVVKARPVFPEDCVMEGDADVQRNEKQVVRTWMMVCDPSDLIGTAIGVQGLLGTSLNVQLTLETLDGRKHVRALRPTQAYYLVPPSPTLRSMSVEIGGGALRQVLRHPEIPILFVICIFSGVRLSGLCALAGIFAVAVSCGQWLKTEDWIGVSSFLPVMLTAGMGLAVALNMIRGAAAARHASRWTCASFMTLAGVLYGSCGLSTTMILSRSEQHLAFLFSALGTAFGLALVILCAGQLHAAVADFRAGIRARFRFWIAYLGGVALCAIGMYQATALLFVGVVVPIVPLATLLGAIALGAWCGAQSPPLRSLLPGVAGCTVIVGVVLALRGISLPQATLAVYASLALVGLLLVRPARLPGWIVLFVIATSCLYQGAYGGGVLRESVALPVAHATAMIVLLVFLFLATCVYTGQGSPSKAAVRLFGLATVLLAVWWRFTDYREWMEGEVAVEATMGVFRLPVLTIILAIAALWTWQRRRRIQPSAAREGLSIHWVLLLAALFTVSTAGIRMRSPFHTPRAPTAAQTRPIMAMLLTDTYLAFNLPDEDAAFDRLACNLSEDLVPRVYLDSRRRLAAGTRKGAEVTVRDVRVVSVETSSSADAEDASFTYPCKWVVTARVKHWQHIHDRQNIYVGNLTLRMEDDRWKIGDIELLSEEREILSWKNL